MAKLSELLQQRFRKKEQPKMSELAEKTTDGQLTVFSGIFGSPKMGDQEKEQLAELLNKFASEESVNLDQDLDMLLSITSEVKAINNQAAMLHGERIKRAQTLLKKYKEGAFTAWLITTYGNRQTPYNFLQYYEFYAKMPKKLHPQIESMPRQAVYTLASRDGELAKKEELVRNYKGETKEQMITLIRSVFPLKEDDRRQENIAENSLKLLHKAAMTLVQAKDKLSYKQKQTILELLELLKTKIGT
ncbi:MAG: hypothetical protein S4CHLAM123_00340 [Chlamydiales bacterium]|nr:hypothetical protein [Chlamydiales bacterium]